MSFVFIPSQSTVFANISPASTGQASGLFNALRQTGAALGVAIMATVISIVGTSAIAGGPGATPDLDAYHAAFLTSAALLLLAAAMAWRIRDADAAATMGAPEPPAPPAAGAHPAGPSGEPQGAD
jgi:hypothetical protein